MRALHEYKQKRDFKKTKEPGAKLGPKRQRNLSFVVQEHHASHLHYDFRLEHNGVLKSWAVPKGPSMNPKEKRLAVEVEDHPLSYGSFEGEIPKGEYGGGTVYQWDSGTWKPEGDAAKALKKGHLEFSLAGEKLNGKFILIRTARKSGRKNQWLLIKRSDAQQNKKASAPKAKTSALKKSPFPGFVPPQLAQLVSHPPQENNWVHELKLDGYRLQLHWHRNKAQIFTRNKNDWTAKFPGLVAELKKLKTDSCILDGEAVIVDSDGKSNFQMLQNAMEEGESKEVLFYAFDLLYLNGHDLREHPLLARKELLRKLISKNGEFLYCEHFSSDAEEFLHSACKLELEGMISKRSQASYSSGRGDDWVKAKCLLRQEFVIGGFTEPEGSRSSFGALLLGIYEGEKLAYCGRVGTGFSQATLREIHKKLKGLSRANSPFSLKSPKAKEIQWVKPSLVAEVKFAQWTSDGNLRAPSFQGLRKDKPAKSIIREVAGEKPDRKQSKKQTEISSPDKILFPKEKITKKALAEFYFDVADRMLPHLKNRPLSLLRCPDGIGKACFFQKHFHEKKPGGLELHRRTRKKEERDFLTLSSKEGLLDLVQRGTVEIHAENGRAPRASRPDQIVMDFDPGPGITWQKTKKAAFDLKEILDTLKLKSFVKVSGGKGLHVHIPVAPIYSEANVKAFSHALAREMESRDPEIYTSVISKKARINKIFVDYLRNGEGATAVVPYSLRAREGAKVALPVSWAELKNLTGPDTFGMAEARRRAKRRDPWAGWEKLKQRLPHLVAE